MSFVALHTDAAVTRAVSVGPKLPTAGVVRSSLSTAFAREGGPGSVALCGLPKVLGLSASHPMVQAYCETSGLAASDDERGLVLHAGDLKISVIDGIASVLRHVARGASGVVAAVPSWWSKEQRGSLQIAAKSAGLRIYGCLSDSVAAAHWHLNSTPLNEPTVLVRLGSSSVTASVVVSGGTRQTQVLATASEPIGSWDVAAAQLATLSPKLGAEDWHRAQRELLRLLAEPKREKAKISLGDKELELGREVDWSAMSEAVRSACKSALEQHGDVQHLVLAGPLKDIAALRDVVSETVGCEASDVDGAECAEVLGAARYCSAVRRKSEDAAVVGDAATELPKERISQRHLPRRGRPSQRGSRSTGGALRPRTTSNAAADGNCDSKTPRSTETKPVLGKVRRSSRARTAPRPEVRRKRRTGEAPSRRTGEAPARRTGEAPARRTGEAPARRTGEAPARRTGEAPARRTGEAPARRTGEAPPRSHAKVPIRRATSSNRGESVATASKADGNKPSASRKEPRSRLRGREANDPSQKLPRRRSRSRPVDEMTKPRSLRKRGPETAAQPGASSEQPEFGIDVPLATDSTRDVLGSRALPEAGPATAAKPAARASGRNDALDVAAIREGSFCNPISADEFLGMALSRPLQDADLAPIALPVLLRRVAARHRESMDLVLTSGGKSFTIPICAGAADLDKAALANLMASFDLPEGQFEIHASELSKSSGQPHSLARLALDGTRRLSRQLQAVELAEAFKEKRFLSATVRPERRVLPGRMGLSARELRFIENHLDGHSSAEEVSHSGGIGSAGCWQLLALLELFDVLQWSEPVRTTGPTQAAVLEELASRMERANHFEVLEAHWSSTEEELAKAHKEKLVAFKVGSVNDLANPAACEKMRTLVDRAYGVLKNEKSRAAYRRTVLKGADFDALSDLAEKRSASLAMKGESKKAFASRETAREMSRSARPGQSISMDRLREVIRKPDK